MSIIEQKLNAHLMQQAAGAAAINPYQPTLFERIKDQIARREAELQRLRELSQLLEAFPEINRILELIGTVGLY